jgi:hypothetical protein
MKTLISVLSLMFLMSAFAQEKLADRIYFGGGFGFSANSNQTNVSLSPQVGYKITERYSAGIGITYQYVALKQYDFSISNYGWSLFNRFNVTQQFFGYSEFEHLSFEYIILPSEEMRRSSYNSLLIGAGYSEQLSRSASFSLMALYNVLYDAVDSPQPYNSPWVFRAGIGLGIF